MGHVEEIVGVDCLDAKQFSGTILIHPGLAVIRIKYVRSRKLPLGLLTYFTSTAYLTYAAEGQLSLCCTRRTDITHVKR